MSDETKERAKMELLRALVSIQEALRRAREPAAVLGRNCEMMIDGLLEGYEAGSKVLLAHLRKKKKKPPV